jgi:hypothetical protein
VPPRAAGKIDALKIFLERRPAAHRGEILLNESGVVNISTSQCWQDDPFAP